MPIFWFDWDPDDCPHTCKDQLGDGLRQDILDKRAKKLKQGPMRRLCLRKIVVVRISALLVNVRQMQEAAVQERLRFVLTQRYLAILATPYRRWNTNLFTCTDTVNGKHTRKAGVDNRNAGGAPKNQKSTERDTAVHKRGRTKKHW